MSKPPSTAPKPPPKPSTTTRRGPGRRPGSLNKKTIERLLKVQKQVETELAEVPPEDIEKMSATDVMRFCMRVYMKAKNLGAAVGVARELAPYEQGKLATTPPDTSALPEDLQPDPPPTPDEEGPAAPIL